MCRWIGCARLWLCPSRNLITCLLSWTSELLCSVATRDSAVDRADRKCDLIQSETEAKIQSIMREKQVLIQQAQEEVSPT